MDQNILACLSATVTKDSRGAAVTVNMQGQPFEELIGVVGFLIHIAKEKSLSIEDLITAVGELAKATSPDAAIDNDAIVRVLNALEQEEHNNG